MQHAPVVEGGQVARTEAQPALVDGVVRQALEAPEGGVERLDRGRVAGHGVAQPPRVAHRRQLAGGVELQHRGAEAVIGVPVAGAERHGDGGQRLEGLRGFGLELLGHRVGVHEDAVAACAGVVQTEQELQPGHVFAGAQVVVRRQGDAGEGVAVRVGAALHLPDRAEVGVAQAADAAGNFRYDLRVQRELLHQGESVDVDGGQPRPERGVVPGADRFAVQRGERRVRRFAARPQAPGRQRVISRRFGAVRPQPAGMIDAGRPLRVPRHAQAAVGQHLRVRGAQVVRQVDEHDHLLAGHRVNRVEIGAELAQPRSGQDAGAAVVPADRYVAVGDARAAKRSGDGIEIEVRNRRRLVHGTLQSASSLPAFTRRSSRHR